MIIKSVKLEKWGTEIIFGKGGIGFYLMVISLTSIIAFQLLRKYFNSPPKYKRRIQYFIIGVFIFILANFIFNVVFPLLGTYRYYQLGDYSAVLFLGITAYAILKKELFGIKVVATGLLVLFIGSLFFVDILAFTGSSWIRAVKIFILFFFLGLGYYLVKSVIKETKQRESLEKMTSELREANKLKENNIAEIKKLKEGLEKKVKERTKELKEAKTALEIQVQARTKELKKLNDSLEEQIKEKTEELQTRVDELEKYHQLMVGRELKMIELKNKIEELEEKFKKKRKK